MSPSATLRLHAEIETPRPLRARAREVTVKGWCLAEDLPDRFPEVLRDLLVGGEAGA